MLRTLLLMALIAMAVLASPAHARGKLGFATTVDVTGLFNPVLKEVKVASVTPGSPAAAAGLQPGDYIIEADGRAVAGLPAKQMAAKLRAMKPGEQLRLTLKRGTQVVTTVLTAGS